MNYKIEEIEGIGATYGEKLSVDGITDTEALLAKCASPAGRKEVAEKCGISEKLVLKWCNHADLMRVNGIGPQNAELLECSGVDTVKELRTRVAANLAAKMTEVNNEKNLAKVHPTESVVQGWIDQAKELDAVLTY